MPESAWTPVQDTSAWKPVQEGPHGFWENVKSSLSAYNPVEVLKDWYNRPEKFSALTDALAIEHQIKKEGRSEPNADERAKLDALHSKMGAPGDYGQAPVGTEPALKATQQAAPESIGGQGDPAGGAGTMVGSYGPALVAPTIVKGAKAAVPAAANVIGKIPIPVAKTIGGVGGAAIGKMAGGWEGAAAGGLAGRELLPMLVRKINSIAERAPASTKAPPSVIVPGETPPAERPAWRQDVVSELNPEPLAQPGESPAAVVKDSLKTQSEPAYVPPALKDNPMAMDASVKLRDVLGGKTEPPSVIEKKINPKAAEPSVAKEAVNRDKRAEALAQFLHAGGEGMGLEDAAQLDPLKSKLDPSAIDKLWKQIDTAAAHQYGLKVNAKAPSMATQRQVLDHLQRLWAPALDTPAKLNAAQNLRDAMNSNVVPIR